MSVEGEHQGVLAHHQESLARLREQMARVLVGQEKLVERLLIAILSRGHILVEGLPGLAKTTAIRTLASALSAEFSRIQFTPDLLPADIVGTQIYNPREGSFSVKLGPVHANLVLADEINRAPAKVQSALLEAMQEKQVTIGEHTFKLKKPFLVLATQNPVEQEGTYPLPEAQIDRFMLKVLVGYPTVAEEIEIMKRMSREHSVSIGSCLSLAELESLCDAVENVFIDEKLLDYIAQLSAATRHPQGFGLKDSQLSVEWGASPRASIFLVKGAKAYAFLKGRHYVTPQDIKDLVPDIYRHRVKLSYESEARGYTADSFMASILAQVPVP